MEMLTQAPTVLGVSRLLFVLSIKINIIHFLLPLSLVMCVQHYYLITRVATSVKVDLDNTKT